MSIEQLTSKIAARATEEVAAIEASCKEEVAALTKQTQTEIAELHSAAEDLLAQKCEHAERVAIAKANQTASIEIQKAKRESIDSIFAEVIAEHRSLAKEAYVAFYVAAAKKLLPENVEATNVSSPVDRVKETEVICSTLGIKATVATDASLTAGLLLRAIDGVYEVTFDRILSERRPQLEMELFKAQ